KREEAKSTPPIRSNSKTVMSMADLEKMEFDLLEFTGRWKEFIGEPQRNFYAICYGKPKNGKSYMSLQFAKYMSRFGPVLYNAAEEGFAPTLRKKLQEVGITANSRVFVSPARSLKDLAKDIDSHQPLSAVFVDSVSIHTNDNTEFDEFRRRWPNTAFICVMHATKNGDF
ncbi:hypothetical protein, partial [Solibacillus isronensis]|uniref:hypothetical protein n=1 Tax=Solibacillus isronensis TaxID=412383 RepID=UPI000688746A